jgi:hypothetical protein
MTDPLARPEGLAMAEPEHTRNDRIVGTEDPDHIFGDGAVTVSDGKTGNDEIYSASEAHVRTEAESRNQSATCCMGTRPSSMGAPEAAMTSSMLAPALTSLSAMR